MKLIASILISCLSATVCLSQQKNNGVVQFNINHLLNARPVTTLSHKKITTWTKGIDGGGSSDGYLTNAAALFIGDKDPHALPDESLIPANEQHPAIQLHYGNKDFISTQACSLSGEAVAAFSVPYKKYEIIYLALTSAEGGTSLKVELTYNNGTEVKDYTVPDYYQDVPANDPNVCYLSHDLAKWGPKNNMTEKDHHNIDLLKIAPDSKRLLKSIKISKTKPGYLVFWAATGIRVP